jgi:uncharacterized cupredoxin-like copper-binding protein
MFVIGKTATKGGRQEMHTHEPDRQTEASDQREFDQAVDRSGKAVLEILGGVGVLAALLMSMVALIQSGGSNNAATAAQPAMMHAAATAPSTVASTAPAKLVDLKIIPISKMGPDGKKHDAFTQTEFAVKVGQVLKLRIDNKDEGEHSITSPVVGVNVLVKPGIHTYTMVVNKAGRFEWYCLVPCDSDAKGWAMQNPGYMSGYITAS